MEEGGMVTDGLEMRLAKGKRKREKPRETGSPRGGPNSQHQMKAYTHTHGWYRSIN